MALSHNLPPALKSAQIPPEVLFVLIGLEKAGHRAYLVGGCVRDILLGKVPHDFDVATSALPAEVQSCFKKVVPTGVQHGTVTVLSDPHAVEVTTFRHEGPYLDGRRPSEVQFRLNVGDDLSRRDFTINAMAYAPHRGEFCDPFLGVLDLQLGLIRCVGKPFDRFSEDGLRALRAVRFASVLGFAIHPETLSAIPETLSVFTKVAPERIWQELQKLLLSPRSAFGIGVLQQSKLLNAIWPDFADVQERHLDQALRGLAASESVLEVRLSAFLALALESFEAIARSLRRLKLPVRTVETVIKLVQQRHFEVDPAISDGGARRWLSRWEGPNFHLFFLFQRAILQARGQDLDPIAKLKEKLLILLAERPILNAKGLALKGNAIMKTLGVGPSPIVGEATRYLLERVLDTPEVNSASALSEILRSWRGSKPS